ncbi:hypothetical protein H8B15_16600 [Hymenobacter sp. BT507]|uniref:CcoQ/FixQ family Cbb3-type cytochrome c oxidase assembly chaperone n=1 Tax=Hymenobacter citatus TaxID=2763506 RepID=A0ABR7MN81_9BACT|nr:hypothetical protein [Hymenobacter citatus]MBC6612544.1 hypothetical protein [Hymenobacter citatus]
MDKNVLRSIASVEIYPIISFVIFFLFFLGLLAYVFVVNRQHVHAMKNLPLLGGEDETSSTTFTPNLPC